MLSKERPDIEVFDTILPTDKVLGSTLAKAKHQQTILIKPSRFRAFLKQRSEVFERNFR